VNVATQRRDPDSLLNWMERVIRMRKEVPEIGWGDYAPIDVGDPAIVVLRYEWRNNAVLFIHNLGQEPCEVRFPAQDSHGRHGVLINLLSEDHSRAGDDGQHCVVMEPYGYRWFRVGGLDYLLERSDV
jgi:maltose alpha-D-glucosyltransferase/alpha-amylase